MYTIPHPISIYTQNTLYTKTPCTGVPIPYISVYHIYTMTPCIYTITFIT